MSSTARGTAREASDYYVTPQWAILEFLHAATTDNVWPSRPVAVLDPCAGGDEKRGMAYPMALRTGGIAVSHLYTVDIREDSLADNKADYLEHPILYQPDVIITNPPFNLALAIIKKALADVAPDGLVIMLQRLNFFGSQERSMWFKENMPQYVYVHSKRMSFHPPGARNAKGKKLGSDSIEYAHFVWRANQFPKFSQLRVL